jgi:putative ATP-dependent endonuclease of OLD family
LWSAIDTSYNEEYSALVNGADVKTLPIEYYRVVWRSFARKDITARSVPLKVAYIDSSHSKSQNGSDIYISRIVKNLLSSEEIAKVSQSHRKMKESFMADESIEAINKKISKAANISNKEVKISVELSSGNAWENSLTTYLDGVPFKYIGKGEQNIVKTNLALAQIQPKQTQLVLLEEPENHLSHTKLHQFLSFIKDACIEKQILITTHSSFVSNKLGLKDLILLDNLRTTRLTSLGKDTQTFFEKISGYDTLRLILCEKAILVEGASDELVVQKAYQSLHNGRLPIEDRVEVISVGLSFLRFLEIAQTLQTKICVVTDNDGDVSALNKKYSNYLGENTKPNINICFDEAVDNGELNVGIKGFNYNTLEPKLLKGNSLSILNSVFEKQFSNEGELLIYMNRHKTDCALKVFESNESLNFPQYILDAVS